MGNSCSEMGGMGMLDVNGRQMVVSVSVGGGGRLCYVSTGPNGDSNGRVVTATMMSAASGIGGGGVNDDGVMVMVTMGG